MGRYSDCLTKDPDEMKPAEVGELGKTVERDIFGVVALEMALDLRNRVWFSTHLAHQGRILGMMDYQLRQCLQQDTLLLEQRGSGLLQLDMQRTKLPCQGHINDDTGSEEWVTARPVCNFRGSILKYARVNIEHPVGPAIVCGRLSCVDFARNAASNVGWWGDEVLTTIEEAQGSVLDDTYGVSLMSMWGEALSQVFGTQQLHVTESRKPPYLTLFSRASTRHL